MKILLSLVSVGKDVHREQKDEPNESEASLSGGAVGLVPSKT